jgi:Ca-activated chloride channel family protein
MQSRQSKQTGERVERRSGKDKTWHPQTDAESFRKIRQILCRQASWRWLVIVLMFVAVPPVPAAEPGSDEVSPGLVQTGSLLLKMKSGYSIATRMNTSIDARINGLVARVSVRQEFRNDGTEWVEGVYVFPLPDQAAVDQLRMYIGDRFIEGEIREKDQAKKEYEAAKATGKKASLVEQQRANLFTTSVANIAPGEAVVVEIEYLETLSIDEGTFSLRIPLTVTPRYVPGQSLPDRQGSGWAADTDAVPDASLITPPVVATSNDHKLTFTADLNPGVSLDFVASRYHVIDVVNDDERYQVGLANGFSPMDHDLELTWRPVANAAPRAMLFTENLGGKPHALLMMLPPDDLSAPLQLMPRELIFVIDTSGSMHGTSLDQAKRALSLALNGLKPADRFNVIQFNSTTNALFPGSVVATAGNINLARRYVAGLAANGGTEMVPALGKALAPKLTDSHLRQVIFITDGSVANEDELFRMIEERLGNTRLFTVGIGSAPNSWFMRKAAEAGRGTFTMISALHEVNEKMERLFRKLEQPQLTDIVIEWPNGGAVQSYPATISDLYAGEPIVVSARLDSETEAGDTVRIRGNSMLGTWDAELQLDTGQSRSGVAALWARSRIEELMDRQRRGAPVEETRKEVIATALAHHLVSKYTSLVAIDKTPVRPAGAGLDSEQVPSLLPYGQSQNAIFGFPATATSGAFYRWNGILLTALGLLLMFLLSIRRARNAPAHRV